jgi:hypothetical protein
MQRYGNTVLSGLRQYCKVLMRNCNIFIRVLRYCSDTALRSCGVTVVDDCRILAWPLRTMSL